MHPRDRAIAQRIDRSTDLLDPIHPLNPIRLLNPIRPIRRIRPLHAQPPTLSSAP
jgi:hypothetical protein